MKEQHAYFLLIAYLISCLTTNGSCQSLTMVSPPSGKIKGVIVPALGQDVVQFRNIPYAKPPVDSLRFKKPQPIEPWTEIRDGTTFGPSCMQDQSFSPQLWDYVENKNMSEDCLQLNIYKPVTSINKMPVMVWIHGGAYQFGSATGYDGSFFALKGVILVTLNYRLGLFGFISTGNEILPGNYGLWDQIEALKWVHNNIASFGGDPGKVTIFGESAGGFASSQLALLPRNKGLFQRVIAQSGSVAGVLGVANDPYRVFQRVGSFLGCITDTDDTINARDVADCISKQSSEDIIKAQTDPNTVFFGTYSVVPVIWPVIDGDLIVRHPIDSLNRQNSEENVFFQSLDYMTGFTSNEGSLILFAMAAFQESMGFNLTDGISAAVLCEVFGPAVGRDIFNDETIVPDLLCKEYSSDNLEQQGRNIASLFSDVQFYEPTIKILDYHVKDKKSNVNTYQYVFSEVLPFPLLLPIPSWMEGSEHGSEVVFMFGPDSVNKFDASLTNARGRAITDTLVSYWTNFAKTGNPNGEGLLEWNQYTTTEGDYMDLKFKPAQNKKSYEKRMKFLMEYIPNKLSSSVKTEL